MAQLPPHPPGRIVRRRGEGARSPASRSRGSNPQVRQVGPTRLGGVERLGACEASVGVERELIGQ